MKEEETSHAFHRWFSHQIGSIEFLTFYILRDGLYNRLAMYNGVGIQQAVAMVLSAHSILTITTKFGLTACMWWALDLRWDLPQVCRELCEDQQLPGKKRRVSTREISLQYRPVPSINLVPTSSNATDRIEMALSCCFLFLGFEKVTAEIADGPVNERRQSFTVRFIIVNQIDEKMWRTCLSSKSHFPSCHFSSCFSHTGWQHHIKNVSQPSILYSSKTVSGIHSICLPIFPSRV